VDWALELHEVVEVQEEDAWRNAPDVREHVSFRRRLGILRMGRALVWE
jgi:hypothetical protein